MSNLPRERGRPDDPTPFRPGVPALDEFPVAQWRASVERAWRTIDSHELGYGDSAGHPALRRAVAEYVRVSRGVRCTAADVDGDARVAGQLPLNRREGRGGVDFACGHDARGDGVRR